METTLSSLVATFGGILLLATVAEALVEYYVAPFFKRPDGSTMESVKYVSMLVGIALAIAYDADLLAILGLTTAIPLVGPIITGSLVGRGSNFIHDFYNRVKNPADVVIAPVAAVSPSNSPDSTLVQ